MDTKAALVTGLRNSLLLVERFVGDLTPEQMLHRPCTDGNCAAWIVGHLAATDQRFAERFGGLDRMPPLPEGFADRFSTRGDAAKASDFGDVSTLLPEFRRQREALIKVVEAMDPSLLDKETGAENPMFTTIGSTAVFNPLHTALHVGQVTIIRRSLGMPPLV